MPKVIGIDYGSKRVGIAISDSSKLIAEGLCTIDSKEVFNYLQDIVSKEDIDSFVIGVAKDLNNKDTDSTLGIQRFILKIEKSFPNIQLFSLNEMFTSKMASKVIAQSGIRRSRRRDKSLVDKISATIILQDYLNYK